MKHEHPFDPVDILARLDWTEYGELEFKSAKGGVPKSLWETYSAMANTHGGVILLGVEQNGTVSGVDNPDRFEFSNPGSLLISFDQLLHGGVSECRNKSLQGMFMMIGGAEKAGSGVDKILRGWQSQHWRMPAVREQFQPDRVQWMLPMISLIPEESLARLTTLFGPKFSRFTKLEVQALVTADLERTVDNARMRQITGGHAADMTKLLQTLVAKGFLNQEGQGRWTRYRLPAISDPLPSKVDSLHKSGHSLRNDELTAIAAPALNQQRLSPKEMEKILLDLCKDRWLTRNEISTLVHRNPESLRQRYINPMVEHGLLRLRYPEKPNRTDQAYTTVIDNA